MKRVISAILLSLLAHFLFGYGISHFSSSNLLSRFGNLSNPIEVEIKDLSPIDQKKPAESRPVVLQSIVPASMLKENNDAAKLLSERRQRVNSETVAQRSGLTVNRTNQNQSEAANKPRIEFFKPTRRYELPPEKLTKNENTGIKAKRPKSTPESKSNAPSEPTNRVVGRMLLPGPSGLSTINEHIAAAKMGEITALNTDPYLFYSFYQRLISQIRFHWEHQIEYDTEHAAAAGLLVPRKDEWISQTSFELDATGRIVSVQLDRGSGYRVFDEAALTAIRAGGPFINPPREMIDPDGRVRLQLGFTVNWIPPKFLTIPSKPDSAERTAPKL